MVLITNIVTIAACVCLLAWPSLLNIIFYPFSKKRICVKISDYIVHRCAPLLFAILKVYKHFRLSYSKENFEKLPEQFIVISNHQSLMDIPIFMTFFPDKDVRFVAKEELGRHVPLISEMLRSHEHCVIPRKGGAGKAMRTIESFGKRVLERKQIPIIFPEGTRSKDGELLNFYSAGFRKIAETTNLPVVVCCLDNGYKINDFMHVLENISNIDYKVKVIKIYEAPKNKDEQVKILEESKVLMQRQLEEWRR
ncbi:lysophospholipid acyltransferase family protein [Treponema sp.]|uniref:lysophospholipid acyltransferase family protein n=1 Tax=Treponema sp. TaxID=166 RepID=UPI00298D91A7|nr:lysophospholipid acyltransferase family protein [Treponema sp.]